MADASYAQQNFTGGEWSQSVQGRFDEKAYATGLNKCFNAIPLEEGNWTRRPGTRFAGFSRRGNQGRLIAFDLVSSAPLDMELTPSFLRIWQNQQLVLAEAPVSVTAISSANPAAITVGSARTWNTGDSVQLFISPADTNYLLAAYVSNRQFVVTKVDTTHFTLADQLGNTLDGSQFSLGASTVTVAKILEIGTPWIDVPTIEKVRISQSEATVLIFAAGIQTQNLSINTANTPAFSMAAAVFIDGPYLDPPTNGTTVQSSATSGSSTLTFSNTQGFTSGDVGRNIRLLSEPPDWVAGTSYSPGDKTKYNGVYYNCIAATGTTNPPDTTPASQAICPSAAQWCYAVITAVASGTSITVNLKQIPQPPGPVPIISPVLGPLLYTHDSSDPIKTFQLGLYTNNGALWPTNGTYHEGRFWFAGSVPNRVDSGVANNGLTCSPTYYDGTVADDNGISAIFNFPEIMQLLWMLPVEVGILCGTQSGEVLIQSSQLSDPITPTSIQAHRVTKYGCANVEPVYVGYSALLVQRYNQKVLDFTREVYTGRHSAMNVSLTGHHLTVGGVAEIRFQREFSPVMWARATAIPGVTGAPWIGMSYKRESSFSAQGPLFNGWHQHQHGGSRFPKSFAAGPSIGGTTDTLGMLTALAPEASNPHHIEFLTSIFQEGEALACAWFLDDAIVPVSANVVSSGGVATGVQFYGFWHGIGLTISAYLGGLDCGDYVVASDGSITVPFGSCGGLFTLAYYQSLTSTCNLFPVTYTVPQPPDLVDPTIMSMGTTQLPLAGPAICDWANRRFIQFSRLPSNPPTLQSFGMDTGAVVSTSPVTDSANSQASIDSLGNIFTVDETANNPTVLKYNPTLALTASFLTSGFGTIAHGSIASVSLGSTNYLVMTSGDQFYTLDTDTMTGGAPQGTLSSAKNSLLFAGVPGSGACYAVDGYLVSTNTSFKLWRITVPSSAATVGTILATDVDAAWTHISAAPLTTDLTDGNPIVLCTTTDVVTHQNYIVKLNSSTGAAMWAITTGGTDARNNGNGTSTNTRIKYGTLAYYDTNGNVYCIDTIAGTILSTVAVSGISFPSGGGVVASDDTTGDIYVFCDYTEAGGTPVPIGNTPSTFSGLWGRLDLASGDGIGTQDRTANFSASGVIGFTYNSDGQLLRPQDMERSGARNGPALGKKRKHHQVAFQLLNAVNGSLQFGTVFPPQYTADFKLPGDASYPVTTPFTGVYWNTVVDDFSFDGMLCWRIGRPYPLTVTAIEGYLHTQDR